MSKVKRLAIPFLTLIVSIALIAYIYFVVLVPVLEEEALLRGQKNNMDIELAELRNIMNQHDKYQAEILMYKSTLDRYYKYAEEYGSYDKIILVIQDIERRSGASLSEITITDKNLNFEMETTYHGAKIFISALENIEFLYSSNRVFLSAIEDRFAPIITSDLDSERNIRLSINADFYLENIDETKNLIQILIEEIGVRNAYVLE